LGCFHVQMPMGHIISRAKHFALSLVVIIGIATSRPANGKMARHGPLLCAGDAAPHEIFYVFSATYAQSPLPALACMPSTDRGLIFLAGQQCLTHAQVAEQPQVAAFRLSRPASIRRVRVWPPRMGPRMSLTVRSARSFHERSQRTGPDDPSETNLPVFHRPQKASKCRQAARSVYAIRQSGHKKAGRRQLTREKLAKRNPALRSSKSNPQSTPRAAVVSLPCRGADLQVRAGPPGPAQPFEKL